MKDPTKIDVPYPDTSVQEKIPGKQLFHAPQPALPVADETAIPHSTNADSITAVAIPTINNMRSRIDALEAVLIKLGLLKHP